MNLQSQLNGTYGTMYYVRDMTKAIAYWKNAVGIAPTYESAEWTQFNLGGHLLCLHGQDPKKSFTAGGILITQVKNLTETVAALKKTGVEFMNEVHEVCPGAYSADFRDADGNTFSLYEDTNAR